MWGKLLTVLVVGSIIGAVTFLGWRGFNAALDRAHDQGVAEERVRSTEALRVADAKATQGALADRDRIIAAVTTYGDRAAALKPIILTSHESEIRYAESPAGKLECRGADRVQAIDMLDASLFNVGAPEGAGSGAGSVPTTSPTPSAVGSGIGLR